MSMSISEQVEFLSLKKECAELMKKVQRAEEMLNELNGRISYVTGLVKNGSKHGKEAASV